MKIQTASGQIWMTAIRVFPPEADQLPTQQVPMNWNVCSMNHFKVLQAFKFVGIVCDCAGVQATSTAATCFLVLC